MEKEVIVVVNENTPLTTPSVSCYESDFDPLDSDDDDDDDDDGYGELGDLPFSIDYNLYPKRWVVLASFCLINISNGWSWATWSPLTALVADSWNVSQGAIDALSGINMFVFVPGNIASMWLVVNYLGLSNGLRIGALLHATGVAVRYAGVILSQPSTTTGTSATVTTMFTEYHVVFVGTTLCAVGNTFILPMITLLSGNWFGEFERATATSLGVFAYNLGCMLGLGSTIVVNFHSDNDSTNELDDRKLDMYLRVQLIVSFIAFCMISFNISSDRPRTPPSEAAATLVHDGGMRTNYRESVELILSCPGSRTLFFVFGLSMGVFYAIPTFLSQFMPTWDPHMQGWLGGIYQISAVLGCTVAGKLVSLFEMQYKKVAMLLLGGSFVCIILYLVSVYSQSSIALVACGGLGFCFCAFMTVGMEYATALTFPADEAAVYGILDSTGELCGFFLVLLGGFMSHVDLEVYFCSVMTSLIAIALVVLWRLKGETSRPGSASTMMYRSKLGDSSTLNRSKLGDSSTWDL